MAVLPRLEVINMHLFSSTQLNIYSIASPTGQRNDEEKQSQILRCQTYYTSYFGDEFKQTVPRVQPHSDIVIILIMNKQLIIILMLLLLGGCASTVPSVISSPPSDNPTITQVREDIEAFIDTPIRWGGTIAEVQNLKSETLIEIVARNLWSSGRPQSGDQSEGRFQARIDGFLDPEIYEKGRALTVAGTIEGEHPGQIGEHPYRYPLVNVTTYYLWDPLPASRPIYYDPWFYDPWWPTPFYYDPYHYRP